jgi:hypothetical protein
MNFENYNYTEIGIGISYTGAGIPNVGPYVITQNFGMRGQRYVVGVIFDDKNKNQEYDPGEGIPGVRVQPSSGSYHAITSTSGGYAFPYTGTSTITLTASGGGLPSEMRQTVQLTGDNVKVDFMPGGSVPGAVTLAYPANSASNTQLPANLGWKSIKGATGYQLQVSTSQGFFVASLLRAEQEPTGAFVRAMTMETDRGLRLGALLRRGQHQVSQESLVPRGLLPRTVCSRSHGRPERTLPLPMSFR